MTRTACALLGAAITVFAGIFSHAQDLDLHGTIQSQRSDRYIAVPFDVPAGTRRIDVSFHYTGAKDYATLDLGLQDPERFRGWSGGNKDSFSLGIADATPSYLPGPLPAGSWSLIIGVAWLAKGHSATYDAHVHLVRGQDADMAGFGMLPTAGGERWYRGDLHLHTAHSDGTCASQSGRSVPCPVFVSVAEAARHDLDFLAITDHNTTSHYDAERELQPYFDHVLLIPGREMTTHSGHANIWGITSFVDFRTADASHPSKRGMLAEARTQGAVVSINHPVGPDDARCIGCGWLLGDGDIQSVDAIEVVNGPSSNPGASSRGDDIAFWEQQLREGRHLTAVGGSDTHRPDLDTIGLPTTAVFAHELSVPAILEGIRDGHVFIDLTGSRSLPKDARRLLELSATSGSAHASMGDTLLPDANGQVTIKTHVVGSSGSSIRFIVDGGVDPQLHPVMVTSMDETKTIEWRAPSLSDGRPHWLRVEVRATDGALQLLGNPIYLSGQSPQKAAREGR